MFDNCGILTVESPLWREDRSVIYLYNCFWALPEQSLWGPSPTELRAYCTLIWDSLNLEGHVSLFIFPNNRVAQLCPRALGSLFVAFFDSKCYGGGILARMASASLIQLSHWAVLLRWSGIALTKEHFSKQYNITTWIVKCVMKNIWALTWLTNNETASVNTWLIWRRRWKYFSLLVFDEKCFSCHVIDYSS
jgi:hypothetical protein